MSILDPLLFGGADAGLYGTAELTDTGLADVASAIESRGWDAVVVDGTQHVDKTSFMLSVGAALQFPEGFTGRSWDAFEDWLTDLSWLPDQGRIVVWNAPGRLLAESPRDAATARAILDDAVEFWRSRPQHFSVIIAGHGFDDVAPLPA